MEIRIGIQHVTREVIIESDESTADIEKAVAASLASGSPLCLDDSRGGRVVVPAGAIGYVHIAASEKGRVGFGIG